LFRLGGDKCSTERSSTKRGRQTKFLGEVTWEEKNVTGRGKRTGNQTDRPYSEGRWKKEKGLRPFQEYILKDNILYMEED